MYFHYYNVHKVYLVGFTLCPSYGFITNMPIIIVPALLKKNRDIQNMCFGKTKYTYEYDTECGYFISKLL